MIIFYIVVDSNDTEVSRFDSIQDARGFVSRMRREREIGTPPVDLSITTRRVSI